MSRGDVFSGIPGVRGECKGAEVDGVSRVLRGNLGVGQVHVSRGGGFSGYPGGGEGGWEGYPR